MGSPIKNATYRVVSADGHASELAIFSPTENVSTSMPVVMIHPALGTPAGYYHKMAETLSQRNKWHVAVEELRGNGTSSWRASRSVDWSYWTPVAYDIPAHIDKIKSLYPDSPLFVMGHSVGGILLSFYMANLLRNNPEQLNQISGFLSIASGLVYHKIHPSKVVWWFSIFLVALTFILGWYPGKKFGFGSRREAKSFINDWGHEVRTGTWEPKGCPTPRLADTFKEINKPVFFMSIDKDTFVPHVSAERFASYFQSHQVTHVHISSKDYADLSAMPVKQLHFKWARSEALLPHIESWIKKQLNSQK